MKKIIFIALLAMSTSVFAEADPITSKLKQYNCMMCHGVDTKVIGPSFKDVAAKYKGIPSAEDVLVKKVSQGTKGAWGSTPMPPNDVKEAHQADIRRLVQYVLRTAN